MPLTADQRTALEAQRRALRDLVLRIERRAEDETVQLTVRDTRALAASGLLAIQIAENAADAAEQVNPAWQREYKPKS